MGTFSQELRYASPRWRFGDLVAGAYILSEDARRQLAGRSLAARTGALSASTLSDAKVRTDSYAVFVDATLHLPAAFDLTGGVRYTYDEKTADLTRTDFVRPTGSFGGQGLKVNAGEPTPRLVLAWKPSRNLNVYGSVTRGFTSGGFNTEASSLTALRTPFRPETVTNFELGAKALLLDARLRLNAAIFKERYQDKQELVLNTQTGILNILNASQATVQGGEIEASYQAAPWLNLTANYGRLYTKYDRFQVATLNNTGNPLGSSPPNKYSAYALLDYPLGGRGFATGSLSYAFVDSYYTGATRDPNLRISGYDLIDLTLGYQPPSRRWGVSFYARNLADTAYVLTPSTQGVLSEYLGAPRTLGVTLRASL